MQRSRVVLSYPKGQLPLGSCASNHALIHPKLQIGRNNERRGICKTHQREKRHQPQAVPTEGFGNKTVSNAEKFLREFDKDSVDTNNSSECCDVSAHEELQHEVSGSVVLRMWLQLGWRSDELNMKTLVYSHNHS